MNLAYEVISPARLFEVVNLICEEVKLTCEVITGGVNKGSLPAMSSISLEHIISLSEDDTSMDVRLPEPDTSDSQGPE